MRFITICALFIALTSVATGSTVDTLWARYYDEGTTDIAQRVGVDAAGNVYASGQPYWIVVKYYPDGDTAWFRQLGGDMNDMLVTEAGEVYMTGDMGGYTNIKMSTTGDVVWSHNFGGGHGEAITMDDDGNIYTTGVRWGDGTTGYDCYTVKHLAGTMGDTAWARSYSYSGANTDCGNDVAVGLGNHVFVTGESYKTSSNPDFVTFSYDANGIELWSYRHSTSFEDIGISIATDNNGYSCATGYTKTGSPMGFEDYMTIRFNPGGDTVWTRQYNGAGSFQDIPTEIFMDQAGYMYVTGTSYGTLERDYTTIKYDQAGNIVWQHRYDKSSHSSDWAIGMFLDHNENIWVTGRGNSGIGKKSDWVTLRYTPDGDTTLVEIFDGEGQGRDYAYDIAVGTDNKFYVSGYVAQTPDDIPDMDFAVVAYQILLVGDADGSGAVDIDDAVYLISYIFASGPPPDPIETGDADCSGDVDIDDVVYVISYIFAGGPPPGDPDDDGVPDC
jgi:hypothetical protein